MTPKRFLKTLRAMAPVIVGGAIIALAGLCIVRQCVPPAALEADRDIAGNYLQTLGSIYAVLLAFVVFVVWTQFNEARSHVEQEANELLDFCRTARGFPPALCKRIQTFVWEYVDMVLLVEWPAMAEGSGEGNFKGGWDLLDRLSDDLHAFEPETRVQQALFGEMLARLNGLCDARTNRLSASRIRIPLALRLLLYSGAALTVGSLYLFPVRSVAIHTIMTAAMAGAISHIIYVIEDLDDCFAGDWQVPKTPFFRVKAYIDRSEPGVSSGTGLHAAAEKKTEENGR